MKSQKSNGQIAALPYRKRSGRIEILLVTSRETKRWIIPKGWPMKGLLDYNAARQEAFEEAGVKGRMRKTKIGDYVYQKKLKNNSLLPTRVAVYPLLVQSVHRNWKEKLQRQRAWFSLEVALQKIDDADLRRLLSSPFDV